MARLNCCRRRQLKRRHGDRMIAYHGSYYLYNEPPAQGQGQPEALADGTPIRFLAWFMEIVECPTCRKWRQKTNPSWS